MTEQVETVIPVNPALVKLVDVSTNVTVRDMNYMFHYNRLVKPDNNMSSLFALHYKEEQQESWSSCKNLLTDQFTVAKTDMVISQIQENLGGTIQSEHHYRHLTSVKSTFTLAGFQINMVEEPEIDLLLFKLVTNISAEVQLLTTSNLTFNVINGMSGNHALSLNFGLLKTMISQGTDKIVPINNVFILDCFTKRLIHDNRMSISIEDVTNVQTQITTQVSNFKRIMFTKLIFEDMINIFPKKFMKRFESLYEALPENLRNFYYVTHVLSSLIEIERKIDLEVKLRSYISKKFALMCNV